MSGCYLQVDCAYYSDDLQEVNEDPRVELQEVLDSHGMTGFRAACPQCFDNLLKLVGSLSLHFSHELTLSTTSSLSNKMNSHKGKNINVQAFTGGLVLNTRHKYLGICAMHVSRLWDNNQSKTYIMPSSSFTNRLCQHCLSRKPPAPLLGGTLLTGGRQS